jgi:DNA-binding NarL/FixJ family response regulator
MPRVPSVLVVDDYEPWRRHVSAELEKYPRFRIVAEARDGLEAVRTAHTLAPDLILLDIGLPGLNGLEAARRILAQRRSARILIVTEQHSPDIAEAALQAGARGYLFKMDAGRDLLFAMEAVVNGGGFLSSALAPHFGHLLPVRSNGRRHEVGFFSDEASILDAYVRFAESGIRAGHPVIVLAAGPRRTHVLQRLEAHGVPIDMLIQQRRCVPLDAPDFLSQIMLNDRVDEERFREAVVPCIADACSSSTGEPRVMACGEMAPRLWSQGNMQAALQLERLWDGFVSEFGVETLCGYAPVDVPRLNADDYAMFQQICEIHSAVHVR